jgi:enterochelin esterase-like enzyme
MSARVKTLLESRPQTSISGQLVYYDEVISPRLRYPRDIIIWLPPSYTRRQHRRYPVLYAHDGQNLMDPSTAFLGRDWKLDEIASDLIRRKKIQEIIIVGIYNTPDRLKEYAGSAKGKAYAEFIVRELKPFMDDMYRTDRSNTGVIGSSMGGLISFYLAWWYPEIFTKAACMSSSFLWNKQHAVREVLNYTGRKKRIKFYLDVGEREPMLLPAFIDMVGALREKGFRNSVDLEYHLALSAEHSEPDWSRRVWRPLQFLFGRSRHAIL